MTKLNTTPTIKKSVPLPVGLKEQALALPIALSAMINEYILRLPVAKSGYQWEFEITTKRTKTRQGFTVIDSHELVGLVLSEAAQAALANWDSAASNLIIEIIIKRIIRDVEKMLGAVK